MPDYAGNNLLSAREISFAVGSQTFSDRVDTLDTDDYYRINLSGRSSINLAVNGLSANANLQLLDRNGNTLQSSTNSAGIAESINQVLDANTYYIRVYQDSNASTDYTLNLTLQNSPKTDILWRDYSSGTNSVWFMGGTNNTSITASSYLTSVSTNWHVESIADFNGDNHPDLLWRDYGSGANAVWFMGGTNNTTIASSTFLTSVATNWHIEGTADFNGDNRPDLLWRDYSSGANAVWFMGGTNNTTIASSTSLTAVSTNWHLEGTADFNGDNRPDLLWRDYSSGANAVWFMGGTNNTTIASSTSLTAVSTNWHLEGTADFNGDNRPDLLWRDYSSGANAVWFMGGTNNTTIASFTSLTAVSTNWQALPYTRYEEPLPIDLAGNTTNTAFTVGTLNGSGVFSDRIDSTDPNDYYRFTLASASTVNLSLNGLSANADIQLLNSNGTVIQGSYNSSNSAESIGTSLSAGTYYVRVYQASGSTTYNLSLSATTPQIYKYNFTYYYNGNNTNADYYTGYVYDYAGKYSVNTFYNPNTALNQAGYDGRYYITGSSLVTGTVNPGYVYASTYYDVDSSGTSYAAYYGNSNSVYPSGYNGLGSEYDYVYDASRGTYDDFGNDNLEVDSLPIVTLTASDANAAETLSGQTANPGQFTITRTGSTATALTVNYGVGGTATSGSDYSGVATSVTIAAGQSSAIIPINVLDDSLIEGNETVNFVLLANSAYGLGSNTSATVTIADNDAIYKYSFTYYYNGSSTSADYYTGYVYANPGTYTVGSYFDYTSSNNQAGYNGKYYIANFSIAGSSSDRGKVYATTYYDVDSSGNSYSAYYANLAGYASGSNGLGTESDYIYDGSTYRGFGSDRDEVDVPRGYVTVTSPNGGNVLRPGSSQTITWSDNLTENVKIDLYKGGNFYATIAASVLSNGSYTWTLPTSLSNGSDYAIRVSSVNNSSLYDASDTTFSVKADLKKFWFYYNFNPQNYTQADSYVGSVIAPDWMYALNGTYDPSSAITEAGLNGKYLISQVDDYNDDLISEAGRVFVNDYIDRDNGSEKHFTPYKYSQGVQPSGTTYLGSELDYIDASQSLASKFGQDYYEADVVGGWFSQHVKDTGLQLKGDALFADGKIDRNDMIAILKDSEDGSAVDSTEYSDLKTIVDSYSDLHMDDYVHVLANKIVKGDVANGRSGITELSNVIGTTNSVTQMDNLINKWFLGIYLPSTYVLANGDTPARTITYSTQPVTGSLFGTDGQASYTDIQQGYLGDCYFLASLGALALQRSSTISNMFIDNRDGTYTVRLFGVAQDGTASRTADYVTVNKILPASVYPGSEFASYNGNSTVGLWVALAEKAYAQFAEEGTIQQDPATNNYSSIEGGFGLYGMASISGISAGRYCNVNYYGTQGSFLSLSDIASKLASGYAMTADTIGKPSQSSSDISSSGIVYGHEYIIVGANISTQTVTLYNPWGDDNQSIKSVSTGDSAGFKSVSYNTFSTYFNIINDA